MCQSGTLAKLEPLDRRVQLLEGSTVRAQTIRMSDLLERPFVVLLGEPGSGKSSVLQLEAERAGTSALTVRTLINDPDAGSGDALFLDALDEYRIDGHDADRVQCLSKVLLAAKVSRWRVTCRSEDWRKDADLADLRRASAGRDIVVAKLLPLDRDESAALLVAFGESDPGEFIAKADSLGAAALLRSPLSLKLLHKVVSHENHWPESRYELYAAAMKRLVHEHNDHYKVRRDRTAPSEILAAAENACLLFLVSGARAIWRSNSEPPRSSDGDTRAYLTAHDLQLEHRIVADMLDTGLFTGEGEEFEPLHRSVAEYLAGRALATAVKGTPSRAAFPLTRAIAMITSADGIPPSELRGLYAWFAAHLSRQGDAGSATRLIHADAATVLFYGDAGAFGRPERLAILFNLDRNDPYFHALELHESALGGLAKPDLASEFAAVLTEPTDATHRLLTVFEALASGELIPALRPLLRQIALDQKRPEWHRLRAAEAWLNAPDAPARELFDALATEEISPAREVVRLHLASKLAATDLTLAEIKILLADFERTPEDDTVGRLIGFAAALSTRPLNELFASPVNAWLPQPGARRHSVELEHALDALLAAAIRSARDAPAAHLWSWINNSRGSIWSNLHEQSQVAVREWLDGADGREEELFDAILTHEETQEGPWMPGNAFIVVTGREPSAGLTRALVDRAATNPSKTENKRLKAIAVEIARRSADAELYQETEGRVLQAGDLDLLERLQSGRAERQRAEHEQHAAKRNEDTQRARTNNLRILTPLLDELKVGLHATTHLRWAAEVYFSRGGMDRERDGNIRRLTALTDEATLTAIFAGWEYLATQDVIGVDAVKLGKAEAENKRYYVEWAALAGIHRRFQQGNPPALNATPITAALVVLRWTSLLRDLRERKVLLQWALDRINAQPEVGARALGDYWIAAVDAGAARLEPLWKLGEEELRREAVTNALDELLASRPNMPKDALRSALSAGVARLDLTRLRELAERALGTASVVDSQRRIWSFAAFALDPLRHGGRFLAEHREDAQVLFDEDLHEALLNAFRGLENTAAVHREAGIIRLLARSAAPQDDTEGWHFSGPMQTVRTAITMLSRASTPDAGVLLTQLANDVELQGWRSALRHARATWATIQREKNFRHPSVSAIRAALQGGPPLSGSDLLAVVSETLRGLAAELRSSENQPWKTYWNIDSSSGKVDHPVIENECRSRLLERLNDRLMSYDTVAAIPEAQRRDGTRADMLIISHAARTLPVEVKRHYHEQVWTAVGGQLLNYTQTHDSDGCGIYLVFWFGNDVEKPPKRSDGRVPQSAGDLEALLIADLAADVRDFIRVIVFDVSRRSTVAVRDS